jgi:hypothetical protein
MNRDILWSTWDGTGLEHLRLRDAPDGGLIADSAVIVVVENVPYRLRYRAVFDRAWRTRSIHVIFEDEDGGDVREISFTADGLGNWRDADDELRLELEGCIDIDSQNTPFTNTLPIRRLSIREGQVEPTSVVYIAIPSLEVTPVTQRYTGLPGGRYRYESLTSEFVCDIEFDNHKLVTTYSGLFKRVWANDAPATSFRS